MDNSNYINELLTKFRTGSISQNEKAELDLLAKEDPFLAEAIEGFEENGPAFGNYSQLVRKSQPSNGFLWSFNFWMLVSVFAGVLVYFVFTVNGNKQAINVAVTSFNKIKNTGLPIVTESKETVSEEKQEEIKQEKTEVTAGADFTKTSVEVRKSLPALSTMPVLEIQNKISFKEKRNRKGLISFNCPYNFFGDLIYIDYKREGRYKAGSNRFPALDKKNNPEDGEVTIVKSLNAEDAREKAMLAYQLNDYKTCLYNFSLIENYYPDDLNARFYKAKSFYALGNYKDAANYFDLAFQHTYNLYKDEAAFFLADCLIKEGELEEGAVILTELAEANGLFKEKAIQLLKKIEKR